MRKLGRIDSRPLQTLKFYVKKKTLTMLPLLYYLIHIRNSEKPGLGKLKSPMQMSVITMNFDKDQYEQSKVNTQNRAVLMWLFKFLWHICQSGETREPPLAKLWWAGTCNVAPKGLCFPPTHSLLRHRHTLTTLRKDPGLGHNVWHFSLYFSSYLLHY